MLFISLEKIAPSKNINLTINEGEIVAFVGGSGSGKSSILKLITGLLEPESGEILIDNKNINTINRDIFSNSIGIIDQDIIQNLKYNKVSPGRNSLGIHIFPISSSIFKRL